MIRLIISALFILAGIIVVITAAVGNFRFGYVLNRMQVGATADTLGATLVIMGLIVKSGFTLITLKLVLMVILLWVAGPVSSHFLARTEIISNEKATEEFEVVKHGDI
ncbi:MAG: monovalent cation/H(+) antiporter subunit G [Oscillospiraceae bacterium]